MTSQEETGPVPGRSRPEASDPLIDGFDSSTRADRRQDMLSAELHHRVQNTLAIVLSLARITARACKTIEEFQEAFADRVQAMARTNALLLRDNPQAIDVRAALEVELEPYATPGGPVTLDCEPILISADAALSLSLMVHELATNAAKYGGLSTPGGRLAVGCTRGPEGGVITWRETSPGQVAHDRIAGAGSALIQRLAKDLGGDARFDFAPTGLEAVITFQAEP